MGLQPIDLQTMYTQISNAAKLAVNVEHTVAQTQKAQQQDTIQKNEELNSKVQKSGEDQKSGSVNQNGHNQQNMAGYKKNKKDEQPSEEDNKDKYRLKESYLGQHIDITR